MPQASFLQSQQRKQSQRQQQQPPQQSKSKVNKIVKQPHDHILQQQQQQQLQQPSKPKSTKSAPVSQNHKINQVKNTKNLVSNIHYEQSHTNQLPLNKPRRVVPNKIESFTNEIHKNYLIEKENDIYNTELNETATYQPDNYNYNAQYKRYPKDRSILVNQTVNNKNLNPKRINEKLPELSSSSSTSSSASSISSASKKQQLINPIETQLKSKVMPVLEEGLSNDELDDEERYESEVDTENDEETQITDGDEVEENVEYNENYEEEEEEEEAEAGHYTDGDEEAQQEEDDEENEYDEDENVENYDEEEEYYEDHAIQRTELNNPPRFKSSNAVYKNPAPPRIQPDNSEIVQRQKQNDILRSGSKLATQQIHNQQNSQSVRRKESLNNREASNKVGKTLDKKIPASTSMPIVSQENIAQKSNRVTTRQNPEVPSNSMTRSATSGPSYNKKMVNEKGK